MNTFLNNAWYVAGWSHEVNDSLFHRKILDQDIVFYRKRDGALTALSSRCPHRFAPLHYGDLVADDRIRCRYHGLEFGPSGACMHNPNSDGPPPNISVRSYPVIERYNFIWIWMGESNAADPNKISDEFSYLAEPESYTISQGAMVIECDYRFIVDNLLDAAHANFLHDGTLACEALTTAKSTVREENGVIFTDRRARGFPNPLFASMMTNPTDDMDNWADSQWHPASCLSVDAGAKPPGAGIMEGIRFRAAHMITPESKDRTHYFWGLARNFGRDDDTLTEQITETTSNIFINEDKWILEGQQQMLGDAEFWDARPSLLECDQAAVVVRKRIEKMVMQEKQASNAH